MKISIVIATHNRADLLDECLGHIARQRFTIGDEVIVVDNGSTDGTSAVIARHKAQLPVPLRGMFEPTPGKSHALALALSVAAGDVLAFTDDDVHVDDGWLAAVRDAMSDPGVALIGGPVMPRWERAAPAWLQLEPGGYGRLAAPLALLDYGPADVRLGVRTALGANLAVRRDAIAMVGGFALHLGKRRGTLLSGEDHDLCQRVTAAGLIASYCPRARVTHWVPADRMRLRYFLSWFYWSGITHEALEHDASAPARALLGVPLYLIRRFIDGMAGALAAFIVGRTQLAANRAADAAFSAGYVAARWRIATVDRPHIAHPASPS